LATRAIVTTSESTVYAMDHIKGFTKGTFLELFGDRGFKDDKAMVGGLGKIDGQSFMIVGQQKGYNTKTRQFVILEWPIQKVTEKHCA
jgi:acetyl-CoA carboxylase carboxyl transferase subunit alpha